MRANGRRNDQHNAAGVFPQNGNAQLLAPRSDDRDPSDGGQYGIALRYLLPQHNNTELGLYFVNYHSRTPYVSGYRGGITAAQTMAFGDYLNDLEMLRAVEHSYAMANAHPAVLRAARHVAPANTEDGVLATLREVFDL